MHALRVLMTILIVVTMPACIHGPPPTPEPHDTWLDEETLESNDVPCSQKLYLCVRFGPKGHREQCEAKFRQCQRENDEW